MRTVHPLPLHRGCNPLGERIPSEQNITLILSFFFLEHCISWSQGDLWLFTMSVYYDLFLLLLTQRAGYREEAEVENRIELPLEYRYTWGWGGADAVPSLVVLAGVS